MNLLKKRTFCATTFLSPVCIDYVWMHCFVYARHQMTGMLKDFEKSLRRVHFSVVAFGSEIVALVDMKRKRRVQRINWNKTSTATSLSFISPISGGKSTFVYI